MGPVMGDTHQLQEANRGLGMGAFIAGKYGGRLVGGEKPLIDRVAARTNPQSYGRAIPDVAVPIRAGAGARTQHVGVGVAPYYLERSLPQSPGSPPDMFEHDDALAEEEPQPGAEQPDWGVQETFECSGRFLFEVECTH